MTRGRIGGQARLRACAGRRPLPPSSFLLPASPPQDKFLSTAADSVEAVLERVVAKLRRFGDEPDNSKWVETFKQSLKKMDQPSMDAVIDIPEDSRKRILETVKAINTLINQYKGDVLPLNTVLGDSLIKLDAMNVAVEKAGQLRDNLRSLIAARNGAGRREEGGGTGDWGLGTGHG